MMFSPLQRRALAAMGLDPLRRRAGPPVAAGGPALGELALPSRMRGGLDRWVGGLWSNWPAPPGQPGEAAFKRALWRRVRDWRRGG
ncbi:MAG TPA: hypothetical protein DCM32_00040 [Xanthomonadaceae bacterium]|jgi:hypothetical protein|nr:hypothetical protein [Xanthomonadaceae bacterium]